MAVGRSNTGYDMDTSYRKPGSYREAREKNAYSRHDTVYNKETYRRTSDARRAERRPQSCSRCDVVCDRISSHRMSDTRRTNRTETVCPRCGTVYTRDVHDGTPGLYCEIKEEAPYPRPGAGEVTSRPGNGNGSSTGTRPPPFSGPKIGGAQPLRVATRDPLYEDTCHAGHINCDMNCKADIYDVSRVDHNALLQDESRSPDHTSLVYGQGVSMSRQPYYQEASHTADVRDQGAYRPQEGCGIRDGGFANTHANTRQYLNANGCTNRGYIIGQGTVDQGHVLERQSNQLRSGGIEQDYVTRREIDRAWSSGMVLESQDVWPGEEAIGLRDCEQPQNFAQENTFDPSSGYPTTIVW